MNTNQLERRNYIEFRVYLKDKADEAVVKYAASELQDYIADKVSDYYAPEVFTEDVTYEVKTMMSEEELAQALRAACRRILERGGEF